MATQTLIPVAEYLRTNYRPDRDYVDGILLERNVGQKDHSRTQRKVIVALDRLGYAVFPEQRLQVRATRFRIPDVCLYAGGEPAEQVFTTPPALCVEILSPDDTLSEMQERIDDYLAFGVLMVWVLDPRTKKGYAYTAEGMREAKDGVMRTVAPPIELPLPELFG
jgi:Uma2 family endonuclease